MYSFVPRAYLLTKLLLKRFIEKFFCLCSEELYEDETFPERELSALVASKVCTCI